MRARCKARFVTSTPSPSPSHNHGHNHSPKPVPASPIKPSLRAFHSFFGSKFKAPKTPPSHGFSGFVDIKAVAKSGEGFGARLAAGNQPTGRLQRVCRCLEIRSEVACGRGARLVLSRPRPAPATTTATAKSPSQPAQSSPAFASFTPFLRANSRPQKRPYRTVSGAWLLSKR